MHNIGHMTLAIDHFKMVFVVPYLIGPFPLFVYKELSRYYLCYLGHPVDRYARKGEKPVGNDLAGVYLLRQCARGHLHLHVRRREYGQVAGIAEEVPDRADGGRNNLLSFYFVHLHIVITAIAANSFSLSLIFSFTGIKVC